MWAVRHPAPRQAVVNPSPLACPTVSLGNNVCSPVNFNAMQLVGKLMDGVRLEVPPRDQIPGCDTPSFQGLDTYVALMR